MGWNEKVINSEEEFEVIFEEIKKLLKKVLITHGGAVLCKPQSEKEFQIEIPPQETAPIVRDEGFITNLSLEAFFKEIRKTLDWGAKKCAFSPRPVFFDRRDSPKEIGHWGWQGKNFSIAAAMVLDLAIGKATVKHTNKK